MKKVNNIYLKEIEEGIKTASKIKGIKSLVKKITTLRKKVYKNNDQIPSPDLLQFNNYLFELKVIVYLEQRKNCKILEYEPTGIDPKGKKIDLLAIIDNKKYLIELKSIHPRSNILKIPIDKIGSNIVCNEQYYTWISRARSHLVDNFYETELKMKNYQNIYINVLCLYQNFFIETWDVNYFLFYYKNKEFKNDDSLGKMMEYFINKKEIKYCNNIHETWLFPFMQYSFKLKNSIIKFINI